MAWRDVPFILSLHLTLRNLWIIKSCDLLKTFQSKWNIIRYVSECLYSNKKTDFVVKENDSSFQLRNCWWQTPQTFKGLRLSKQSQKIKLNSNSLGRKSCGRKRIFITRMSITTGLTIGIWNGNLKWKFESSKRFSEKKAAKSFSLLNEKFEIKNMCGLYCANPLEWTAIYI